MTEQTFIKGKDSALETSIDTMHAKLKKHGFEVEEASWLNPVANCYSVHIKDPTCGLMFTNGKGATAKACLASALGEYFERLSCNYFFADFYLGEEIGNAEFVHYPNEKWFDHDGENMPEGLMDESLWDHFDPNRELSPAQIFDWNSGAGERGICAAPYHRVRDGKDIYIPINVIANVFVSNGMSAGNTQNEARVQGLSEVFERYVKNKIIAEGICLPEVPKEVLARFPQIEAACQELESHGFHLRIADASLGGKYPVMSVTLINPVDGSVFASFGAHPSFEVALERTVTELLQGRSLDQLNVFQPASFDEEEIASAHNIELHFIDSSGLISYDFFKDQADYEFADWDFDSDTATEYQALVDIIHQLGFDIYISDYRHLDVYACRILVPGMSDIYPVDEILWNNNNDGALFREAFLTLPELDDEELAEVFDGLEEGGYNDALAAAEFIGLAPDAGTLWADMRLGELKALIAMAMQDERAIDWVNWCLHLDQLNEENTRKYRCLQALLEIKWDDNREYAPYLKSLGLMYGEALTQLCLDMVEAKVKFHGLHCPGLSLAGFNTHQKLLAGYKKLQAAKASNWS
ncbi:30S ribosomal protein S12 methylthiotransferase accessory factor YcaO [Catenovulum sp. 2E275]|uniref:30S ribosomal protein S12 methylthiotransferase accessory factor YcaO n=1 Tax=Catenovulum sp. 2E275 TaxID=2980497 RepID=UPI0021D205EA|nr:30S ribosomal protein S12 methylthiotransferase accessory factor YcaO [Catenovulum sp. 2E275]MCU4677349.1 30S ribosomal protein S12 methylthiotransferase accessory factor YcaO [Catenovulum sp. 2E275]